MKEKIIKDDGFEGSKAKSIINADLENIRNGNFDSVLSNEKLDTDEVYEILIKMAIDSKDALLLSALNSIKNKKPTRFCFREWFFANSTRALFGSWDN